MNSYINQLNINQMKESHYTVGIQYFSNENSLEDSDQQDQ